MSQVQLPKTYFAVIFCSQRTTEGNADYEKTADRMLELAKNQEGFLGVESAREIDGFGITVSYWESPEAIRHWHQQSQHQFAQQKGYDTWYQSFKIRICKVERDYGFERDSE